MVGSQTQKTDRASLFEAKEKELLLMQNEVLRFIDTKHDAEGTQKYMKAMREAEIELNNLLLSLLAETENVSTEFKEESKRLCEKGSKLKDYTRDINKALECDLDHIKGKDFDAIKIGGFVAAFPVMLVAASKNLLGENSISNGKLTLVGIFLGALIAGHKKIKPAWKAAGNAVCNSSDYIKKQLNNYDMKGSAQTKRKAIINSFQKNGAMMIQKTSKAAKKGRAFIDRIRDRRSPPAP